MSKRCSDVIERLQFAKSQQNGYGELADDCIREIERLSRDKAALQSQWDDMQQGFVEVFGEPVRDAIELLGATERLRAGAEPGGGRCNAEFTVDGEAFVCSLKRGHSGCHGRIEMSYKPLMSQPPFEIILRQIINHWHEFGAEHSFDELIDFSEKRLKPHTQKSGE